MLGPLLVEPTGDFNALDGMYPAEVLGDVLCFVGLYGPDKMPAGVDIIECCNFLQGFLQIVFAKIAYTVLVGYLNGGGGPGFTGRNDTDVFWPALAFLCSETYSVKQGCYIVAYQCVTHTGNVS